MLRFIFLFCFFLLNTLSANETLQTRTQVLMGTFVSISLPSQSSHHSSKIFLTLKKVEDALSSFDKNASLARLNQRHKIKYNKHLGNALILSQKYYTQTQGYFDISIGSISKKLYHFGEENSKIPSRQSLQKAILNIDGIEMNTTHIYTDANITLDLGGMGKGYGVDIALAYLEKAEIKQGIIALSGDIRCLDLCEIYLQSPFEEKPFAKIRSLVKNLAISSSGTYRRFVGNRDNHHLINPKTATQGKAFVSVSLFSTQSNALLDAYATAISVMPKDKALAFLKKHTELAYVLIDVKRKVYKGNLLKLLKLTIEKAYDKKTNTTDQ
jgi:thiamine biosynthesis lipoprotein